MPTPATLDLKDLWFIRQVTGNKGLRASGVRTQWIGTERGVRILQRQFENALEVGPLVGRQTGALRFPESRAETL